MYSLRSMNEESNVGRDELIKTFLNNFVNVSTGENDNNNSLPSFLLSQQGLLSQIGRFRREINVRNCTIEWMFSFVLLLLRVECSDEDEFVWSKQEIDTVQALLNSAHEHLTTANYHCIAQYYRNNVSRKAQQYPFSVMNSNIHLNRYCVVLAALLQLIEQNLNFDSFVRNKLLYLLVIKILQTTPTSEHLDPYSSTSLSTICSVPIIEDHLSTYLSIYLKNIFLPAYDNNDESELFLNEKINLHPLVSQFVKNCIE